MTRIIVAIFYDNALRACAAALIGVALCSAPAMAQQKTAKQCNEEWTANKASIQASKKTKKDFVAECRGMTTTAAKSTTPPAPTAAPAPPPAPSNRAATTTRPRETFATAAAPVGAGQFGSELAARAHCPADTVVWANLGTRVYHFSGNKDYGHTKRGAFMCERETAGFRAAKNEKHP